MTQVGRYQIVEELGRGAMGIVYKALDPTIGRTVAIKAIRLTEFQDPDERERIHQRLWREARSAGVLSHPNIVTIFDLIEQDSAAYIVMECVNGASLGHLFRRGALPPRPELLRYLRQVAEALDYAHQKGVVHRDVKPGNIIISDDALDGQSLAKMADFGVAKFISQETTHSGTMIGTPSYLSPEQIETDVADARSDQFSLAVVTYELLTGQKPFDSENLSGLFYQICKLSPKPADQLNPLLPSASSRVLMRGLSKEPSQRFATCTEMVTALENSLGEVSEYVAVAEPVISLPAGRARRFREEEESDTNTHHKAVWPIGVAVGLAAALLCAALLVYRSRTVASVAATAPSLTGSVSPNPAGREVPGPLAERQGRDEKLHKPRQTTVLVPEQTGHDKAASDGSIAVSFQTEPAGARVQVDEQPDMQCTSPCMLRLSSGRHTMIATETGYETARRIFNVPADNPMSILLERSMGVLLITSDPSGSDVTVDGKPSGKTPVTLHLSAGPHQISMTSGDQHHEETVNVVSDEFISRNLKWQ